MSTPTAGRRIARRQRRGPDRTTALGTVLVAMSVALLLAAGVVEAGTEPVEGAGVVPVDEVTSACVAYPGRGRAEASTFSAPLTPAGGSADAGAVVAGPVGGRSEPVAGAGAGAQRLPMAAAGAATRGWALVVTATGKAAVGRSTFEVDRAADAAAIGVQECLSPRSHWWFTGGGAGLDHSSTLVVANLDPGPAVFDIEVHGPDGPVDSVGTRGITLPAGEVLTVRLVDVAPQTTDAAVRVEASRGRVVAALADSLATRPAAVPGRDWIPAQVAPSRVLRLAPLPTRADRRTLVLANPTGREALADVEVAGESGTFVPTEVPQVRVPAGSVVTADLGSVITGEAAAVVVRSPVPLTGTVRSTRAADVAYAAAAPLLGRPAAAVLPAGVSARLHLTARDRAGTAQVVAYSADGQAVKSADLEVPPAVTLAWAPPRGAAYLVVTPQRGRLFGGVSLSGGGLSQVPLRPVPASLRRPVVRPVAR